MNQQNLPSLLPSTTSDIPEELVNCPIFTSDERFMNNVRQWLHQKRLNHPGIDLQGTIKEAHDYYYKTGKRWKDWKRTLTKEWISKATPVSKRANLKEYVAPDLEEKEGSAEDVRRRFSRFVLDRRDGLRESSDGDGAPVRE